MEMRLTFDPGAVIVAGGSGGIGAAISQAFAQRMAGHITVASELGKGTTFTLHLPANITERHGEAVRDNHVDSSRFGGAPPSRETTILVIDDDRTVRDLMVRMLNKEGFRVVTAWGAKSRKNPPPEPTSRSAGYRLGKSSAARRAYTSL